jgi:hypothetical protein
MINKQQQNDILSSFKGISDALEVMQEQMQKVQAEARKNMSEEELELLNQFEKSAKKVAESGDFAGLMKLKMKFLEKLKDANTSNNQ